MDTHIRFWFDQPSPPALVQAVSGSPKTEPLGSIGTGFFYRRDEHLVKKTKEYTTKSVGGVLISLT